MSFSSLQLTRIYQPKDGYRFSTDTLALVDFVRISAADSLLDLGTGVGIIPLLLWQRRGFRVAVGIEVQKELVSLARRNRSVNGLNDRLHIIQKNLVDLDPLDFKSILGPGNEGFDIVTANPPYWPSSRGRLGPNCRKSVARHEVFSTFGQWIEVCSRFLKTGGRFYFVQINERKDEILEDLAKNSFQVLQTKLLAFKNKELMLVESWRSGTDQTASSVPGVGRSNQSVIPTPGPSFQPEQPIGNLVWQPVPRQDS